MANLITYTSEFHKKLYTRTTNNKIELGKTWDLVFGGSPEYSKYESAWIASRLGKVGPMDLGVPWITYPAIDFLTDYLPGKASAFEWGMGGSTLYLRKFVKQVVSVEHSQQWFKVASGILNKSGYSKVLNEIMKFFFPLKVNRLLLREPEVRNAGEEFTSGLPLFKQKDFASYVKSIDRYPDSYFDLVLVDGRARLACCLRAISKIKVGGILILDNSDYARYSTDLLQLEKKLNSNWTRVDMLGPGPCSACCGWRTTIWTRSI